jgi:O-antigen/teichoic acid export membrane protein
MNDTVALIISLLSLVMSIASAGFSLAAARNYRKAMEIQQYQHPDDIEELR